MNGIFMRDGTTKFPGLQAISSVAKDIEVKSENAVIGDQKDYECSTKKVETTARSNPKGRHQVADIDRRAGIAQKSMDPRAFPPGELWKQVTERQLEDGAEHYRKRHDKLSRSPIEKHCESNQWPKARGKNSEPPGESEPTARRVFFSSMFFRFGFHGLPWSFPVLAGMEAKGE